MGSGYDFSDLLRCRNRLDQYDVEFYCSEIICALEHLHRLDIVHLDVKPENILLTKTGHVMLTDFECAFDSTLNKGRPQPVDFRGTIDYMAPEVRTMREITFKADIFSLGVTMARMVLGYVPQYEIQRTSESVQFGWRSITPRHKHQQFCDFLDGCLHFEPKNRLSLPEIKRLPVFKNVKWEEDAMIRRKPPYEPWMLRYFLESSNIPSQSHYKINHIRINFNECRSATMPADHAIYSGNISSGLIDALRSTFKYCHHRPISTSKGMKPVKC